MKKRILLAAMLVLAAFPLMAKVPVVGVSGHVSGSANVANNTYINSIRRAGGVPVIIPVTGDDAQIDAITNIIDALVMTGGEDYDPLQCYGEEPLRALGEVVPSRDEFDIKLVRAAVAKGIPVLGICRGEQLLSVAFGGSLWQDIPSQVPTSYVKHRQSPTDGVNGTHSISIEKGSFLEKCLKTNSIRVNSFHHQAIKDVPQGFKVVGTAADGIVESVERVEKLKNYPDGGAIIVGTQFHPEIATSAGYNTFLPIFNYLISEASK